MKTFYSLLIVLFSLSFQVNAQGSGKIAELVVKTELFCDHCNYCESCKPRIEAALFQLSGVKQAKLDLEAQTIKVVYNTKKTTKEEVVNAILASGYSVDGVQPKASDYAKLDGCCKRK